MANLKISENVKLTLSNSKLIVPLTVEDALSRLTQAQRDFIENFTPQINFTFSSTSKTFTVLNYTTLIDNIPQELLENNFEVGLVIARHHYPKHRKNILTDLYDKDGISIKNAIVSWRGVSLNTDYLTLSIDENSHLIVKNKNNEEEDIFNIIKPDPLSRMQDGAGDIPHEHYYFGIVFRVIDKVSKRFLKTKYSPDCVDVSYSENPYLLTAENGAYRFH